MSTVVDSAGTKNFRVYLRNGDFERPSITGTSHQVDARGNLIISNHDDIVFRAAAGEWSAFEVV